MQENKQKMYLLGTSNTNGIGNTLFEIISENPKEKSITVFQIYVNDKNEVEKGKESKIEFWYHRTEMRTAVSPSISMTLQPVGSKIVLEEISKIYQKKIEEIKRKIPVSLEHL